MFLFLWTEGVTPHQWSWGNLNCKALFIIIHTVVYTPLYNLPRGRNEVSISAIRLHMGWALKNWCEGGSQPRKLDSKPHLVFMVGRRTIEKKRERIGTYGISTRMITIYYTIDRISFIVASDSSTCIYHCTPCVQSVPTFSSDKSPYLIFYSCLFTTFYYILNKNTDLA